MSNAPSALWWVDCSKPTALIKLPAVIETTSDVQQWLASRNCTNAVCQDFAGVAGFELRALTVADLAELLRVDFATAVAAHAQLHPQA